MRNSFSSSGGGETGGNGCVGSCFMLFGFVFKVSQFICQSGWIRFKVFLICLHDFHDVLKHFASVS